MNTQYYEVRDGVLFELRAGKTPLRVCSGFVIENVLCDPTRLLFALSCWSLDIDDHVVQFRILPQDFYAISTMSLEQTFAAAGLYLCNTAALVRYLRQYPWAVEPVVVDDLRSDENDFKEGADRRFRQAYEKTRTAA
jgi:hypothetical protein